MTGTTLPPHPEPGGAPLVDQAAEDIIAEAYTEVLNNRAYWTDGTSTEAYSELREMTAEAARNAFKQGRLTHRDLILCSVYDALAEEDLDLLHRKVTLIGREALLWRQNLDQRGVEGVEVEVFGDDDIHDVDLFEDDDVEAA